METGVFLSFVLVSSVLILVPGPNVMLLVATSLASGRRRGLQALAGTSSAMAIQLAIAALGTVWLAQFLHTAFSWVRWAGVAYLVWLGVSQLRRAFSGDASLAVPDPGGGRAWLNGFIVSMTNPKTILFFGAFLPQFATGPAPFPTQIAVLSVTFLVLATLLDGIYTLSASSLGRVMNSRRGQRLVTGASGTILTGAGLGLAASRGGS